MVEDPWQGMGDVDALEGLRDVSHLRPMTDALKTLEQLSKSFGAQLTFSLKSAVVHGRELEDVLRSLGTNLAGMALSQGLAPLQALTGSLFSKLFSGLSGILPFAKGGGRDMSCRSPAAASCRRRASSRWAAMSA